MLGIVGNDTCSGIMYKLPPTPNRGHEAEMCECGWEVAQRVCRLEGNEEGIIVQRST